MMIRLWRLTEGSPVTDLIAAASLSEEIPCSSGVQVRHSSVGQYSAEAFREQPVIKIKRINRETKEVNFLILIS